MLFKQAVRIAIQTLWGSKLRSALAVLGVMIGVCAVITLLSLGSGATQKVLSDINSLGSDLLIVRPGQKGFRGVMGQQEMLTLADAEALISVPGVLQIAPLVSGGEQMQAGSRNRRCVLNGISTTYLKIRNFQLGSGRSFNKIEEASGARVAIIGSVVARELFGRQSPLGKPMKIKGQSFIVIGVLQSKGDQGWFDMDDQVLIPYTVAMQRILGTRYLREINIQGDGTDLFLLEQRITRVLRLRFGLKPADSQNFSIRNQAEILDTASSISRILTLLLAAIASISLLVGGIGIMNIMLMSVTERTREIGIRKAIGARQKDILNQFLVEAVSMSSLGGFLGVLLSILAIFIGCLFMNIPYVIEPYSIALALGFSSLVGVFFGYYPAKKAAELDPIESLRYE